MNKKEQDLLEADICIHIFSVSAAMVGVCLTVIGIIRLVIVVDKRNGLADDMLAADAILFLASCFLSYFALRKRNSKRMYRIEKFADAMFLFALFVMVIICGLITYSVAFT